MASSSVSKAFSIFGDRFGEGEFTEEDLQELDLTAEEGFEETGLTISWPADSTSGMQAKNERRSRSSESDMDNIWTMLDDHMQEKIIARLPLRSLFRVSSLSKTWRWRFYSPSFRSEVHNSAVSWKPYSPLFVLHDKGIIIGYERSSQRWYRLPSHSYLQQEVDGLNWYLQDVDGSLFCWMSKQVIGFRAQICHIVVGNPLTKTWQRLPARPDFDPKIVHVLREGRAGYKVIAGSLKSGSARVSICFQIFNSTNGFWTVKSYTTEVLMTRATILPKSGSAVINGVLYMLVYTGRLQSPHTSGKADLNYRLISFDVKQEIFKEAPFLFPVLHERLEHNFSQLIVCGWKLMLVMKVVYSTHDLTNHERTRGILSVFQVHLESLSPIEVCTLPTGLTTDLTVAAGSGDSIYIGNDHPFLDSTMHYNLGTRKGQIQEWHWFNSARDLMLSVPGKFAWDWHWSPATYQPGLDPFFRV